MLDLAAISLAFQPAEIEILAQSYKYALSYFECEPPLALADRHFLARLIVRAAAARCREDKELKTIVDAHAIAAEVIDFYAALRTLRTMTLVS